MTSPRYLAAAATVLCLCAAGADAAERRVVVLSAFPAEQAKIFSRVDSPVEVGVFNGRRFFSGTLSGHPILLGLTGIGMVNAETTTRAVVDYCASQSIAVDAIVFSGVAGGGAGLTIGDVVIPDTWSDGQNTYPVDGNLYGQATTLGDVPLGNCLPANDVACTGFRSDALVTPVCVPEPEIHAGGLGYTSDPYGGRSVPCLSSAGDLLGCEACGAPPNTSPGIEKFANDASAFADPFFFVDLFSSFASPGPSNTVVQDMETATVAAVASEHAIPFLAFRAISDGGGDPLMLPGFPVQFFVYDQLAADNAADVLLAFFQRFPTTTP